MLGWKFGHLIRMAFGINLQSKMLFKGCFLSVFWIFAAGTRKPNPTKIVCLAFGNKIPTHFRFPIPNCLLVSKLKTYDPIQEFGSFFHRSKSDSCLFPFQLANSRNTKQPHVQVQEDEIRVLKVQGLETLVQDFQDT